MAMSVLQFLKDHGVEIGLVIATLALLVQLVQTKLQLKQVRTERDNACAENEMYAASFQLEQLVQAGKGVAFPLEYIGDENLTHEERYVIAKKMIAAGLLESAPGVGLGLYCLPGTFRLRR